jgi:hypothetical protein
MWKLISAQPEGARLGRTERSCTSGLYSGNELRRMLRGPPGNACGDEDVRTQ